MRINAPTPSATHLALLAAVAGGLAFAATRVTPKVGRGESGPVHFAWGYVTHATAPDGGTRLLAHVTAPPEDRVIALGVPRSDVRSCVTSTEPETPLGLEALGARRVKIQLPITHRADVLVIQVDLIPRS